MVFTEMHPSSRQFQSQVQSLKKEFIALFFQHN